MDARAKAVQWLFKITPPDTSHDSYDFSIFFFGRIHVSARAAGFV